MHVTNNTGKFESRTMTQAARSSSMKNGENHQRRNGEHGRNGRSGIRSSQETLFLNSRQPALLYVNPRGMLRHVRTNPTNCSMTFSSDSSTSSTIHISNITGVTKTTKSTKTTKTKKRCIRFSTVEVREMPIIAGDVGGSLYQGPPITLDWKPYRTWKKSVGAMEMDKQISRLRCSADTSTSRRSTPTKTRNNTPFLGHLNDSFALLSSNNEALVAPLSARKRCELLLRQGVSSAAIQQATISAQFLNQQRWETQLLDQLEVMECQRKRGGRVLDDAAAVKKHKNKAATNTKQEQGRQQPRRYHDTAGQKPKRQHALPLARPHSSRCLMRVEV